MRKSATRFRKQSELTHILGLILRVATEIMICEKRVKVKKDQFGGGKGGGGNRMMESFLRLVNEGS